MRTSQYLIATLRETPADAEVISHQLMLRAGMIRKLASGMYTWLPAGLRVLHKVSAVVREEMNRSGALEVSMPVVQSADLWQESGRWDEMGPELLRFTDRHNRDFCLGPTHEEVITDLVRNEFNSYKQLPVNLYQIQMKFRDERRPRFGVMRAREFLMKDAYSFHLDEASLEQTYEVMYQTYCRIFERLGLEFRAVLADTGNIGGSTSHEFQMLAESGEDEIVFCSESGYAANIELAEGTVPDLDFSADSPLAEREEKATGDAHTIEEVAAVLNVEPRQLIKTLIVKAEVTDTNPDGLMALVLRGDQELNPVKAEKIDGIVSPLTFASDEEVVSATGAHPGCIGPQNLAMPVFVDTSAAHLKNFICGANREGYHWINANWERDCQFNAIVDIRNVRAGDISPDGKGTLSIRRGIEVGHIFQLGTKYSEAMNAKVLDENGKSVVMTMGCYGIGVSRIVAAAIEQNHDDSGIIWPDIMAPFHVAIIPLNAHKSERVAQVSEQLMQQLEAAGYEVLLDDRDRKTSPGVKFADMELMGIPHRIVVSERGLENQQVEYKARRASEPELVALDDLDTFLSQRVAI